MDSDRSRTPAERALQTTHVEFGGVRTAAVRSAVAAVTTRETHPVLASKVVHG